MLRGGPDQREQHMLRSAPDEKEQHMLRRVPADQRELSYMEDMIREIIYAA